MGRWFFRWWRWNLRGCCGGRRCCCCRALANGGQVKRVVALVLIKDVIHRCWRLNRQSSCGVFDVVPLRRGRHFTGVQTDGGRLFLGCRHIGSGGRRCLNGGSSSGGEHSRVRWTGWRSGRQSLNWRSLGVAHEARARCQQLRWSDRMVSLWVCSRPSGRKLGRVLGSLGCRWWLRRRNQIKRRLRDGYERSAMIQGETDTTESCWQFNRTCHWMGCRSYWWLEGHWVLIRSSFCGRCKRLQFYRDSV